MLCPVLWAIQPATAAAAEVTGKLVMGAYKPPKEPDNPRLRCYWELENGFKEVVPDRVAPQRELAVVLLGGAQQKGESSVEVTYSDGSLLPSTIVVRPDTTLRVRNTDEIAHELYAKGLDKFAVEAISPRAIRSVPLKEAGKWPLLDRLITHVRGFLHVLENLVAVAKVAPDGTFAFSEIAPGKYQLKVFHGPYELASKSIEIGPRDKAELDPIVLSAPATTK